MEMQQHFLFISSTTVSNEQFITVTMATEFQRSCPLRRKYFIQTTQGKCFVAMVMAKFVVENNTKMK